MVTREAHNLKIFGSIPRPATKIYQVVAIVEEYFKTTGYPYNISNNVCKAEHAYP